MQKLFLDADSTSASLSLQQQIILECELHTATDTFYAKALIDDDDVRWIIDR